MVKYVGLIVRDRRDVKAGEDTSIYFDLSAKNVKDAMDELEKKSGCNNDDGRYFFKVVCPY